MKRALSLILALMLCLSLCACGGSQTPETTVPPAPETTVPPTTEAHSVVYKIGDAISTDAMKVVLTDVSFTDVYKAYDPVDDGYSFVVVKFSVQNIGKTELGFFPIPGGSTITTGKMVAVNYDDGYIFGVSKVNCLNMGTCFEEHFIDPSRSTVRDLKPLSDAVELEVAIIVPDQVVENTEASLCIRFTLQNSNGDIEEIDYTIR